MEILVNASFNKQELLSEQMSVYKTLGTIKIDIPMSFPPWIKPVFISWAPYATRNPSNIQSYYPGLKLKSVWMLSIFFRKRYCHNWVRFRLLNINIVKGWFFWGIHAGDAWLPSSGIIILYSIKTNILCTKVTRCRYIVTLDSRGVVTLQVQVLSTSPLNILCILNCNVTRSIA